MNSDIKEIYKLILKHSYNFNISSRHTYYNGDTTIIFQTKNIWPTVTTYILEPINNEL